MATQETQNPTAVLQQLATTATANQPAWLAPVRQAGADQFAKTGFPTLKDEDWRFTNVAPLAKLTFKPAAAGSITADTVKGVTFGSLNAHRLVFVNGQFTPKLSSIGQLPAGVTVKNLSAALVENSALIEKHLAKQATGEHSSFTALNNASFTDGGFVHLAAGKVLETPVHLLFISTATDSGATAQARNLFIAEDNSQGTVLESYASTGDGAYFTNVVTEVVAGDNAVLEHVKFQDESLSAYHIAALHAKLGRTSNFVSHSFA
ncbi:MAG: hypothetical protein RLY20_3247, partial [Verrucomicrobiota bacterium]